MKIIHMYLHINCNKKILFVKIYQPIVVIRRLFHSSCCFLNTNTAIRRKLIRTARTLETELWQVCAEVCVRGQRKMSPVLGAFGLLYFTMLWPVLAWRAFWNLWTVYFFSFPNFLWASVNGGYLKLRKLNPWIPGQLVFNFLFSLF